MTEKGKGGRKKMMQRKRKKHGKGIEEALKMGRESKRPSWGEGVKDMPRAVPSFQTFITCANCTFTVIMFT